MALLTTNTTQLSLMATPGAGRSSPVSTASTYGRRQIVVDQPQGGTFYPFIYPTDDLGLLIADVYLSYDNDDCQHDVPLKIDWLYGFGINSVSVPITPANAYDVQISDVDDNVVFDSLLATSFVTNTWGDSYKILEWSVGQEVLRIVIFTGWTAGEIADGTYTEWDNYFEPTDARLDGRAAEAIPRKVTSMAVVTDLDVPASDTNLTVATTILKQGYNVDLEIEDPGTDGLIITRGVTISADPGGGTGRYPCEADLSIKRINGIEALDTGNFRMDASGCYRLERPLDSVIPGWRLDTADLVDNSLKLSSDCGPCCECDDFLNVYEGIRRLTNTYNALGLKAEAVRDQYGFNRDRWEVSRECRSTQSLRVAAQAIGDCRVAIGMGLCNSSDEPMTDVMLSVCFNYGPDANGLQATTSVVGCVLCNSTIKVGDSADGRGRGSESTPAELSGEFPNYTISFDCISPGYVGLVHWVMFFPYCDGTDIEFVVRAFGMDTGNAAPKRGTVSTDVTNNEICCDFSMSDLEEVATESCNEY
jgi:hypothetical protein